MTVPPRILLTGTRAPATLDLARRLHAQGATLIGADSAQLPLGRFSRAFAQHHRVPSPRFEREKFAARVAEIAAAARADYIWPTCEEIFHLAAHHTALSQVSQLLFPPLATLEPLHHKGKFIELVTALRTEVQAPRTWPAADPPRPAPRLIWKPAYSRFAARLRLHTPPPDPRGWLAQEHIQGREFCAWSLAIGGEIRALAFYTCPAKAGRGAGCAFQPGWWPPAERFIREIARHTSFTGSLAFDFIERPDGALFAIECNPRLTSGVHLLADSFPLLAALTAPVPPPAPPLRPAQLLLPVLLSATPWLAGTSPDILWSRRDPWPALLQALPLLEFAATALRHRILLTAATTRDIEYNGP